MTISLDTKLSLGRHLNTNYIDTRLDIGWSNTGAIDLYLMFAPLCWHLTFYRAPKNRTFIVEFGPFRVSLFLM